MARSPVRERVGILLAAVLLVGCAGGATGATPAGSVPQPSSTPDPASADPGNSADVGPAGQLTEPQPGQLDPHPIPAQLLEGDVIGRSVSVRITWISGIEPCNVLDAVVVERSGTTFALTVIEGRGPGDNVCIEIAKTKQTIVGLGDLEPGTYTIADGAGGAAPIKITVS